MNAKKIMGAVLVALLAAALFVGVGAADPVDNGVLYTYTDLTSVQLIDAPGATPAVYITDGMTFTSEKDGSTIMTQALKDASNSPMGAGFALNPGQYDATAYYTDGIIKFKLAAPNAVVAITNTDGESIVGGEIDIDKIKFSPLNPSFVPGIDARITGAQLNTGDLILITPDGAEITFPTTAAELNEAMKLGKWGVKVDISGFVAKGGPKFSTPVYFTVVDEDSEPTISANKDTILTGNVVLITVNGEGTIEYDAELFEPVDNQINVNAASTAGKLVVDKKGSYGFKALMEEGDATFTFTLKAVADKYADVDVTVEEGEITAEAETDSYYIGQTIKLEGTNTVGVPLYIYIEGTNFEFTYVDDVAAKEAWSKKITAGQFVDKTGKKPDAGSYTIYVSTVGPTGTAPALVYSEDKATGDDAIYTTAVVALKQPFISITSAPSVVIKGEYLEVEGTAESADNVWLYIFGTNYFDNTTVPVKDSKFEVKEKIPKTIAAGQYFAVIQHPMYDKDFNIAPNETTIYLNTTGDGAKDAQGEPLFNVFDRQKANAAEALCQALDTENIDDMYVKFSFIVAAGTSTINPIPSEVVKGEKLTISGSTNGGAGTPVTVEMMSTAFAAVPKDTVGSASFISLTTKTDENGNWEVTFDTTGLNVDEYTVTAAVAQYETTATAKVNVIEGAPVTPEQPDTPVTPEQPEQPEQPTEPETPGFGALAALAGLGAVAVLLLRRE